MVTISAIGFEKTAGASANAIRWYKQFGPWCCRREDLPKVSTTGGRALTVGTGAVMVCGVLVHITSPEQVVIPPVNDGRYHGAFVCLRVDWSEGGKVSLIVKESTIYMLQPGNKYDVELARVVYNSDTISQSQITQQLPYSCGSGQMVLPTSNNGDAGLPNNFPMEGGEVFMEENRSTWRFLKGQLSKIDIGKDSWKTWTPTLMSNAGDVNLGNGGSARGRYKIIGDLVVGEFEIRSGVTGYDFGHGTLSVRLPEKASGYFKDQWFPGHLYTQTEDKYDWLAEFGVADGHDYAVLFAARSSSDCRSQGAMAADESGRASTGFPWMLTARSDPGVITGQMRYVIWRG
ncbi:hypothetical protein ACUY2S_11020 [Corynebacterium parakroppenstedtii]|uniref:hypothetical protein n=1 Tax=Corynebacterium parakroppenstedtii TaxID=2828363 RepID=UPI001C8D7E7D|nr:hypothetical protein [Corynebacterium parakroppenstedtii]MBY0797881.1 hypothetical protein [Corynebacterium parakroppenstedtii]